MNWMTITWPMVAAICLALGLIELRIGLGKPVDAARLLFSLSAFATAAECGIEVALMQADTPERFQNLLRSGDLLIAVMLTSLTAFIWVYFRSGNKWLALAVPCLFAIALVPDVVPGGADTIYYKITSVRTAHTVGGASFRLAEGKPNPWNAFVYLAVLSLFVFVIDAAIRLGRRGELRRALVIGGSVSLWLLISGTHSALIETGKLQMPYIISVSYLIIVLAMSFELTSDVAAAAQLDRQLRDSERRMELASAAVGLGMWTWDLSDGKGWASERARSLLGFMKSEQFTEARFMDAVHADDREHVRSAIAASLTNEQDLEVAFRLSSQGDVTQWMSVHGRVERNAHGTPALMRGVLLDISARRRSELELQHLHGQLAHTSRVSMLGQLATALAHELQQPLGSILRNAEAAELFLEHDPPDLDELRAILVDIRADDKRAREVIDRLRALLRRRSIEQRVLTVADVLANIAALTRADAATRNISVKIDPGIGLPQIMGDAVHLQQVLLNLVLNAMDAVTTATGKQRLITVRAEHRDPREVEVIVEDTGSGIPSEDLGLVFEPFYTTKASGLGIGLSVSRTIVEAHGGRIWAEKNSAGGATFRFTLPTEASAIL